MRYSTSASLIDNSKRKLSNEEIERRKENEKKLKGNNNKLKPPKYMNAEAKKIFKLLVKETAEANTFGNVDIFVLEQFCNTYSNYKEMEMLFHVERNFEKRAKVGRMMKQFSDALPRLYNELGLTPSTRAKLGTLNLQKQEREDKPLLQLLEKRSERLKSQGLNI